jgi:hypothetical protein
MNEEEKKSNKKPIIIVIAYFLAIVILMGIIYSYLLEEEEVSSINVNLHFVTKNENGSYVFEIEVDGSPKYYLYDVNISVYRVEDDQNVVIYKDILLSRAYNNLQNTSLDQNVTYNDLDSNNVLSTGDIISIWIDPKMPGNFTFEMSSIDGEGLASKNFTVK